ncbi:MAG: serine/threonine protein kinase, partial [Planctomycetes bacterium]|nr:serine/threonine protein kinase [Planctomycetota bacterium]
MKATDIDLARLARSRGWVQDDELERALLEADRYQALGLEKSVDEILIEGGHLTAEQARSLRDALGLSLRSPRIGDYEVVRRIGIGGMGSVFEARHVRLRQRIALKVLLPRLAKDSRATERFLEEARTLARLNHPNLVHAVDAGRDDELYYLAMEYVEGENLLQRLMRDGPLEPRRSLDVARDVCRALCALEEKGLVHRDVKPANILVAADGTVRLADFGLLGPAEEEGAGAAPLCGTPHYMSPEQVERRGEVDGRSDLYALAATWYHLVVGRPPFVGKSTREIILGHLHSPVPPPSSLRKEVPEPIERVILRWLAKERSERPGTCREALAELDGLARELDRRALSWPLVRRVLAIATALALAAHLAWLLAPRGREPDGPVRGEAPVAKAPDLAPAPAPAAQPPPS